MRLTEGQVVRTAHGPLCEIARTPVIRENVLWQKAPTRDSVSNWERAWIQGYLTEDS